MAGRQRRRVDRGDRHGREPSSEPSGHGGGACAERADAGQRGLHADGGGRDRGHLHRAGPAGPADEGQHGPGGGQLPYPGHVGRLADGLLRRFLPRLRRADHRAGHAAHSRHDSGGSLQERGLRQHRHLHDGRVDLSAGGAHERERRFPPSGHGVGDRVRLPAQGHGAMGADGDDGQQPDFPHEHQSSAEQHEHERLDGQQRQAVRRGQRHHHRLLHRPLHLDPQQPGQRQHFSDRRRPDHDGGAGQHDARHLSGRPAISVHPGAGPGPEQGRHLRRHVVDPCGERAGGRLGDVSRDGDQRDRRHFRRDSVGDDGHGLRPGRGQRRVVGHEGRHAARLLLRSGRPDGLRLRHDARHLGIGRDAVHHERWRRRVGLHAVRQSLHRSLRRQRQPPPDEFRRDRDGHGVQLRRRRHRNAGPDRHRRRLDRVPVGLAADLELSGQRREQPDAFDGHQRLGRGAVHRRIRRPGRGRGFGEHRRHVDRRGDRPVRQGLGRGPHGHVHGAVGFGVHPGDRHRREQGPARAGHRDRHDLRVRHVGPRA